MGIINQYPYTDMHSINLDYVLKLCRENMGLHLEVSGNNILLKTEDGSVISSIVTPYATEANHAATATSATSAASATNATNAQNAVNATNAAHATTADSATTAATATQAASATTAASAQTADYATTAGSANTAATATRATTADFATTTGSVDHASKAIETVASSGNNLVFTAYDQTTQTVTVPFSTKANRDNAGDIITQKYFANVVDDNGTLKFSAADGTLKASIPVTSTTATSDSYGNTIGDYVKTITAPNDSNYVTVSHGTGTAETLTVNYSNQAWKDTNGNVIKNTYVKDLDCVEDENDGHYKLVAYNGDNPQAELFRTEIKAYSAQVADLATESTHALSADHATTADSATIAATSTGSISSVGTESDYRQGLKFDKGDGTSYTANIANMSILTINMNAANAQIDWLDPTFTVGHYETYTVDQSNLDKYGFTYTSDIFISLHAVVLAFLTYGHNQLYSVQPYKTYDNSTVYCFNIFDPAAAALKVFQVEAPSNTLDLTITRLL